MIGVEYESFIQRIFDAGLASWMLASMKPTLSQRCTGVNTLVALWSLSHDVCFMTAYIVIFHILGLLFLILVSITSFFYQFV